MKKIVRGYNKYHNTSLFVTGLSLLAWHPEEEKEGRGKSRERRKEKDSKNDVSIKKEPAAIESTSSPSALSHPRHRGPLALSTQQANAFIDSHKLGPLPLCVAPSAYLGLSLGTRPNKMAAANAWPAYKGKQESLGLGAKIAAQGLM